MGTGGSEGEKYVRRRRFAAIAFAGCTAFALGVTIVLRSPYKTEEMPSLFRMWFYVFLAIVGIGAIGVAWYELAEPWLRKMTNKMNRRE
jgi:hypothetical protein